MNKKFIAMIAVLSLCVSVTACSKKDEGNNSNSKSESLINIESMKEESVEEANTFIKLGSQTTIEGEGAKVENNKITITSAGTYSISGKLEDGQIVVNADKEDNVYIILNGVDISNSNTAPIYAMTSKKLVISLANNTENTITDGEKYVYEDESTDEPNAAIFSKDDLILMGNGKLTVNGNYNHGIVSKDKLKIQSGNIIVNAKNDGIKGKDCINVTEGNISIKSEGDGMQSNNTTDESKGYVLIEGGSIDITSGEDGIQAETQAFIKGGDIKVNSGGGSEKSTKGNSGKGAMPDKNFNPDEKSEKPSESMINEKPQNQDKDTNNSNSDTATTEETVSTKGIKATSNIIIEGGNIDIDSCDDSIHSNDSVTISGGNMKIKSGDDGVHSDLELTINGGTINISNSYEGLESEVININDGKIHVTASDDGINASEATNETTTEADKGKPGENASDKAKININGGYIYVDATGDGIDSNGDINMKSGTLIVNGPTSNGNGSLDYDGNFDITGGTLIAAGSSGMVQTPSNSSSQKTINISLTSQEANSIVNIQSGDEKNIITFAPSKSYQSVVVSTPDIKVNEKYTVSVGGTSTGKETDGLYSDGKYSGGTEVGTGEVSESITNITQDGATSKGNMGGPGGDRELGGQGRKDMTKSSTNQTTTQ
jgi:hypothetical protein